MPKKYDIETIEKAILALKNAKPVKIKKKTKFSKSETIEKIAPTIKRMRERGFSFEENGQAGVMTGARSTHSSRYSLLIDWSSLTGSVKNVY